jgi:hypothetical protein
MVPFTLVAIVLLQDAGGLDASTGDCGCFGKLREDSHP